MHRRIIPNIATLCLAGIVGAAGCAPSPPAAAAPGAVVRAAAPPKAVRKYDFHRCLSSIGLSSDRKLLVGATDMGRVLLVDVSSSKELFSQQLPNHLTFVAFAPDGRTAYAVNGEAVYALSVPRGALSRTRMVIEGSPAPDASSLTLSADGRLLAVGYSNGAIVLWDPSREKQVIALAGHRDSDEVVDSLVFSADGKQLVSGSRDGTIRLWDASTGKQLHRINVAGDGIEPNGSPDAIYEVRFMPGSDEKTLISAGFDGTVRFWDLASGQELRRIRTHHFCLAVAVTPDGKTLITGGYTDGVRLWDVATGNQLLAVPNHREGVLNVELASDGRTAVVGDYEGIAMLIDIPALGAEGYTLRGDDYSDKSMKGVWEALAGEKPDEAFLCACLLATGGDKAAAYLGRRLGPGNESLVKMNQAVARLDSDDWNVREGATKELRDVGPSMAPMLAKAEETARSAEAKMRLAAIMTHLRAVLDLDAPDYRLSRVVQSLEWIGSSRALSVLELLARGDHGPACAQDARGACERMKSKGIKAVPWER